MIQSGNLLSHTYNEEQAEQIYKKMSFIFVRDKRFVSADIGVLNHKTNWDWLYRKRLKNIS
ncbi:hypothetical protein DO021_12150 [Desulfobacter hydrogenophilus]|uniref:Uncharacterized protein n=1 Tax=Desulfobacter hydrogenophilus TaxID=2291 RepID=A0A328FF59_9BACT|nr:hypothetical protein [Desulfobacter hydrogenophilus]NDY72416.1 hypothetical protein [Desulfobacter hydrogenophilus]QBH13740.1 hypothetical protein EYB58_12900 [Desulfobacter hydrogenophilus]RAM01685.1 hypothetical protein DO021_12150 [Desulfobacter hydrogenophilus]